MAKTFTWIVDAQSLLDMGGKGGVAPQYVLPKALAPDPVSKLAGGRIWIIASSKDGFFAFANIFIQQIDEFEEGISTGDYLLTTDPLKSFRVFSTLSQAEIYRIDGIDGNASSFDELAEEINTLISHRIINSTPKLFRKPTLLILDKVKQPQEKKGGKWTYARDQLAIIISSVPLAETYYFKGQPTLPPFANLAYHRILKDMGKSFADGAAETLRQLDPLSTFVAPVSKPITSIATETLSGHAPTIDLNLQAIDPHNIYARKFIAKAGFVDTTEGLLKTENAEKEHQEMLRDIATVLIGLGHAPLQSSSIDLLVESSDGDNLFEIKSSNNVNIMRQAAKGVFQLISYGLALEMEGRAVKSNTLILGCSGNPEFNAFVGSVVKKAGLNCLFYNKKENWPKRLSGLWEIL